MNALVLVATMAIPNEASSKVNAISAPIVALGLALLALTITIAVIAYINSRVPKD